MTIVAKNSLTVSNINDGSITHYAYANSADGTDGFYIGGGTNYFLNSSKFKITPTGQDNYDWNDIKISPDFFKNSSRLKPNNIRISFTIYAVNALPADFNGNMYFRSSPWYSKPFSYPKGTTEKKSFELIYSITDSTYSATEMFIRFMAKDTSGYPFVIENAKLEIGDTFTPWSPAPSEAHPSYIGQYTDFNTIASTDPTKYAPWIMFKGNDGVGVKSTVITYAISTSGTTAPSTGWTSSVPTLVKGQYLWTKTAWTYTDTSSKTGYSVTYISKDGTNGTDGTSGIIVSSVAPDNPQTGQLWQDTSTTPHLVKKWTGNEWVIWELYAQNLKADTLETISAKIGKIYNEFDNSSGGIDNKGTITIEDSIKVDYYNGNSRTTMDLVASSSGQGLFTQHLPDKTDTSKFKQAWYTPSYLYFSDTINNWNGQITAENVTLAPWQNLILRSGYTAGDGVQPQYRRIKNLDGSYSVQFRGAISPTSGNFSATQVWAATVTGVYRPPTTAMRQCSDNTGKGVRVAITTDGGLYVMSPNNSSYAYIDSLTYIN